MTRLLHLLALGLTLVSLHAAEPLRLSWTNNMLRISGPDIPGGFVETWYLEAFCRSGSTSREWDQTTIPHKTEHLQASADHTTLELKTVVGGNVWIHHKISSTSDQVNFHLQVTNAGGTFQDIQWFQPCMRVDRFTGGTQEDYINKSFIFTHRGLQRLHQLPREENAIYRGGQVYVPTGVPKEDVNPRPISPIIPINGLIGCFSRDEKMILATAWSDTQELFQGVIVCLHNDPRLGGLKPGESKKLNGSIYILPNDPDELTRRYERLSPPK